MGCAQSKIDNEESVARCKERRQFMKEAVASRNAFAAAHSSYIMSLKNTGAALSEYGQAEMVAFLHHNSTVSTTSATSASVPATVAQNHTIDNLPPPPPPLPDFSPSPLRRAATMPVIPPFSTPGNPSGISENANPSVVTPIPVEEVRGRGRGSREENIEEKVEQQTPPPPPPPENKGMTWDYFFSMEESIAVPSMVEEDIHQDVKDAIEVDEATPPVTPQKVVIETPPPPLPPLSVPVPGNIARNVKQDMPTGTHHQHAASTGVLETKRGKSVTAADVANGLNLVQILTELDDHFLKGSESAQEVSKMLEATKLHYHSNFADNRGHIDHSARVMRVITWNKSFKGLPNGENGSDDFDNDEWETHATILDKLLAWEKKLYDEVKAGELMKIEYQRKVALLNRQKKRGVNPEALEKTKAAVSHLHTRYIVDMQSMDSTVSEIQHLRDNQLYPKLSALVDGMAQMWEALYAHHGSQLKMVIDLRALDISSTPVETSEQHYERTAQLYRMANEWHSNFQKLVNHQKEYIQALNSWLKLNIIPIESSLKEKVSSPPRVVQPPIQSLLHVWHDQLEKLHDDLAKSAIHSFAAVINAIMLHQQEELKQKEKCEEIKKEYVRKERAFTDWYNKYINRKTPSDEADEEQNDTTAQKDPVAERRFVVESLHKRVEEEEDNYLKLCKQVREKSVTSLKTHLPELFRALSDFSLACSNMYKNLKAITRAQSNGHP